MVYCKLQDRRHGILVSCKIEYMVYWWVTRKNDMVYWKVTRKVTWYTGMLQERWHGILVSYKKEDMVYWQVTRKKTWYTGYATR